MGNTTGGISPLDVTTIVQGLMTREQLPLNRLNHHVKKDEIQLSVYGQLQSYLQTLQTNVVQVNNAFNSIAFQASSTNTAVATTQVTSNIVAPITHSLNVTQLAQAGSDLSQGFTSNNASLGMTDSLGISVGSGTMNVSVAATDTLMNIRDNINNALDNPGVSASILATSVGGVPQYQLLISSNTTGTANAATIIDATGSFNFTNNTQALDAEFTFDNNPVTRSSNSITDVIDGLSFNLLALGTTNININQVDVDTRNANIVSAVQGVLSAYNQTLSYIDQNQLNPVTRNDTLPLIKLSLQNAMNASVGSGQFQNLGDIGIIVQSPQELSGTVSTIDRDGKQVDKKIMYTQSDQLILSTDDTSSVLSSTITSFSSLLTTNYTAMQSLLTDSSTGILTTLSGILDVNTGNIPNSIMQNMNIITGDEATYKEKISTEETRLEGVEASLYKKYAALNVLLQKFNETTDYLTKQLEKINSWGQR